MQSNMFYVQGIGLSRSDKFGLIWLAANYDPEKYRKMISSRDCEKANICKLCSAIMNPTVPFALRLSAHLMLGTVRVYRTKTKLCLELAEQVMWKLKSLIKEAKKQSRTELAIPFAKTETITLNPSQGLVVDYSIEPYYFDTQLIMHLNDDDFFSSPTPLTSPIKFSKPDEKEKPTKPSIKVNQRQISIEENLVSPRKADDVPLLEEIEYVGGFAAIQDDQLLMDLDMINLDKDLLATEENLVVPPINLPPSDGRLSPVFEAADSEMLEHPEKKLKDKRDQVVRRLLTDDDVVTEEIRNVLNASPEFVIKKPDNYDGLQASRVQDVTSVADVLPDPESGGENYLSEGYISDGATMKPAATAQAQQDWEMGFEQTPSTSLVLEPYPFQPRKKRKLMVDQHIQLDSKKIKNNIDYPEDTVRIPNVAGSKFQHGEKMLKNPLLKCSSRGKLGEIWRSTLISGKTAKQSRKRKTDFSAPEYETADEDEIEKMVEQEKIRGANLDTPATIEVPRDGSAVMTSINQSGGSMVLINQTPVEGSLTKSYDDGMMTETATIIAPNSPSRLSDIAPLNEPLPEINVELDAVPELYPVIEEEDGSLLVEDDLQLHECDDEMENDRLSKLLVPYRRKIKQNLAKERCFEFSKVFPNTKYSRREAALSLYTLLHLHKNGRITMKQKEAFGEIRVSRFNS